MQREREKEIYLTSSSLPVFLFRNRMETAGDIFHTEKHDFDLELVLTALKKCPLDDEDVDMCQYLVAYNELCR